MASLLVFSAGGTSRITAASLIRKCQSTTRIQNQTLRHRAWRRRLPRPPSGERLACRGCGQFLTVVALEIGNESLDVARDAKTLAEAGTTDQRKLRLLQRRPAFVEECASGFEENRLHFCPGLLRHQRKAALEAVYRSLARARAFRKHQQLMTCAQFLRRLTHQVDRRVIANVARQTRPASEEKTVPDIGFHDACGLGKPRDDEN